MSLIHKILIGIAILGEVAGLFFLLVAGYFYGFYLIDNANPLRHEYLMGLSIGLIYSIGLLLITSIIAGTVRKKIKPLLFKILAFPGIILGSIFLIIYLSAVSYDYLNNTLLS